MAKANTNGAPAPKLPEHPFIVPDDPETTYICTENVLALVQEFVERQALTYGEDPNDSNHLFGLYYILEGCREAVTALGHMKMPDNEKLEVDS